MRSETKYHKKSNKNKKDWYRLKSYVHIGRQHTMSDRSWIEPYVKDENKIAKHSFMPFIYKELAVRKFRREIMHDGTRSVLRKPSTKTRDIYYSNHLDAKIYSYYSELLAKKYERKLTEKGIDDCVTAYRRIKIDKTNKESKNKSTVHFANDVFQFIKSKSGEDLVAITFDIKGFFDNLNHLILKRKWREVIDSGFDLPKDHYNVYRNITKFSYVEEKELFELFKDGIVVQKPYRNNKRGKPKKIKIDRLKYFKNKGAISYCDSNKINLIRSKGLIKTNKYNYDSVKKTTCGLRERGIPQGSPISAILANIYMLDFDVDANEIANRIGGIYRRYSDDMIIICPIRFEASVIKQFIDSIKKYKLEIQDEKTQAFHFIYDIEKNRHFCEEKNLKTKRLHQNTQFEYLGFQFDGYHTMIKNSSLSNYYRKMKSRFARSEFYTYHNNTNTFGEIFKGGLYKSYTYKGSHRRRIHNKKGVDTKHDWGNFITYANHATEVIPDNKIKGQMKRFWINFHDLMNKVKERKLRIAR